MARTRPTPTDPFGWGLIICVDPRVSQSLAVSTGANRGFFLRTMNGGVITKVGFEVGTASGNISVAAYANTGTGLTAAPTGAPLSTSGAVACPATGLAQVALAAAVSLTPGDWLFLSCDNATATFSRTSVVSSAFNGGTAYRQDSAHPAPTVGTLAATGYMPMLIGIP